MLADFSAKAPCSVDERRRRWDDQAEIVSWISNNSGLTVADGVIGHAGNGPSGGYPHPLGVLGACSDCFALDLALARVLNTNPNAIPTIVASRTLGVLSDEEAIAYPLCRARELAIEQWPLPSRIKPIDFGAPRIVRSTLKHLYIRLIKEPIALYTRK